MKTILTLAAAIAALTTASASFARTPAGGHWEWQSRPAPGPSKSNVLRQVRIWVEDGGSAAADCMMDLQAKRAASPAG